MASLPNTYLTPEQYLAIERAAERRSEYVDGQMYAMAGAGASHNLIVTNAVREISQQLRTRPCVVYAADMRVRARMRGPFTYPDVTVVCGEPIFADNEFDTLLNPVFLIEVLSPTTEAYDRGRKFDAYKEIETLREYLLISTDRMHADLYIRQPEGRWLLTSASKPEDVLTLESVGVQLCLSDLYEKVVLASAGALRNAVEADPA